MKTTIRCDACKGWLEYEPAEEGQAVACPRCGQGLHLSRPVPRCDLCGGRLTLQNTRRLTVQGSLASLFGLAACLVGVLLSGLVAALWLLVGLGLFACVFHMREPVFTCAICGREL